MARRKQSVDDATPRPINHTFSMGEITVRMDGNLAIPDGDCSMRFYINEEGEDGETLEYMKIRSKAALSRLYMELSEFLLKMNGGMQ